MKRTWLLAALFVALGAGAYYVLHQKKQTGTNLSPDMDFAVKQADVSKIFIANRSGETATLERKDGFWLYNGKYKARPGAIEILLETVTRIKVNYIPPKSAENVMIKSIATDGITVELYNPQGERIKRYYIGGVTNDEHGTYAMMEGAEQPYVVHLPSFVGTLRGRYLLGDDNWRDRSVFAEKPETIQAISVEYPLQKFQSFKLEKTGEAQFAVSPFYPTSPVNSHPQKKGMAEAYLLQYEKLIAEAFETTNPLRDSILSLVPFATVSIKKTDGTEKKANFFPVEIERNTTTNEQIVQRYFVETSNGDFMLVQDRVFGKIFRGYNTFFEGNTGNAVKN